MTASDLPALGAISAPARILIIKPSALGDIVHALPVLDALAHCWPDAKIDWLAGSAFAGLLDGHPQLNRVIRFDRHGLSSAWRSPAALRALIHFLTELRREKFDLVIDLQGLFRSGLVARLARSSRRAGFANARELAWLFYSERVVVSAEQHAVDRYLELSRTLGCATDRPGISFVVSDRDRAVTAELLGDDSPFAVLLPGTNWQTKRWPIENFAALVSPLRERFGLNCIVAGGAGDAGLAQQIGGAVDLAGRTSLPQLVALLERASVVIANDSGPMHIAAALGRPLVALYGPTNPARTGPWRRDDAVLRLDLPCSPCYSRTCSHQSCLRWLSVEAVLSAARIQIDSVRA